MHTPADSTFLRPVWRSLFPRPWLFGAAVLLIWSAPRFLLVLHANQTGSYQWVSLIFVSMWLTPVLFLTPAGRRQMGLTRPARPWRLVPALLTGVAAGTMIFLLGRYLYGESVSNWFVYIARSYPADSLTSANRLVFFLIFAGIGMTFSPIGEELFYRGVVHEAFAFRLGDNGASVIDSAAFALVHLAHFGIVYLHGGWHVLIAPAGIWMALLYFSCRLFFRMRRYCGSILGAILAHAGFNLAMTYVIFFHVLD